MNDVFKKCSGCKAPKLLAEFCKDKSKADGLNTRCKECAKERHKKFLENNPGKDREYAERCREKNRDRKDKDREVHPEGSKRCSPCKEVKLLTEFCADRRRKSGYKSYCKVCKTKYDKKRFEDDPEGERARNKKWREANADKQRERSKIYRVANSEKIKKKAKKSREIHYVRYMWTGAKSRAKKAGIPFDIEPSDIVVPKICPILHIPLYAATGSGADNSPSLDRTVPELGYVKGNIMVMSNKANFMKSNATWEELVLLGDFAKRQLDQLGEIHLVA